MGDDFEVGDEVRVLDTPAMRATGLVGLTGELVTKGQMCARVDYGTPGAPDYRTLFWDEIEKVSP